MNAEFFDAIAQIEREKGIPKGYMQEKIVQALTTAFRRDKEDECSNLVVEMDEERKEIHMYLLKQVVETVEDPASQITLDEARKLRGTAELGDELRIEVEAKKFGRIAAQTARQVIIQGIREAERGMIFDEFTSREHEIMTGVINRIDSRTGNASVRIGSGSEITDGMLAAGEQVPGEILREGDRVKVYVVEVRRTARAPQVLLSRTHPGLVKRLFELEVPEIYDGVVQVSSVAREAGSRTKLAVWSEDPNVDPIGACIGPRGSRVNHIVAELHGEKVDIVRYSEDPAGSLSQRPAPVPGTSLPASDTPDRDRHTRPGPGPFP